LARAAGCNGGFGQIERDELGRCSDYAGVENEGFFRDYTMMLFADAKKMTEEIVKGL
jgi:NAD/NADP transhydrogenase beta subunit